MSEEKQNIEGMFRKKFSDFRSDPSPGVWKKISGRLFRREFLQFNPGKFNIFYTGIFLALFSAGLFLISSDPQKEENKTQSHFAFPDKVMKEPSSDKSQITEYSSTEQNPVSLEEKNDLLKKRQPLSDASKDNRENSIKSHKSDSAIEATEIKLKGDTLLNSSFTPSIPPPLAMFRINASAGCVPLQVNIENLSQNAKSCHWNFGDGCSSTDFQPLYIYDEPGDYIITLTTMNENGDSSIYQLPVEIYPQPQVHFDYDINDVPGETLNLYLYNYSRGAEKYFWDFGDGTISELKDPIHEYASAGHYDIKLLAISKNGCRDSAMLIDPLGQQEPSLIFPNAFTPNRNGGSGGYFSFTESNNNVFHPYTDQVPIEYHLRIFNKKGNLIFESRNFNIGWDGYYRQELQPQGVYIWKVRGRFENGNSFVKMGDVTLIWERNH